MAGSLAQRERALRGNGRLLGDYPGGPRILESVAAALDLPTSATAVSVEILSDRGDMSSPTVLFVLDRLQQASAPRPTVMLAFGPGLVAEAALLV